MKDVGICLFRPATLAHVISEIIDIGFLIPSTLPQVFAENIIVGMLVEVHLGYKITDPLPFEIW